MDWRDVRKMSFRYIIYYVLSTLAFLKNAKKRIKKRHGFEDPSGKGLGTGFWKHLGSILGPFWDPWDFKNCRKNMTEKQATKCCQKSCATIP